MVNAHQPREAWPRLEWKDRLKRWFFDTPVDPPAFLSNFLPDISAVEQGMARLGPDALNFQDRWLFAPMNRRIYTPLWFFAYQVQAYRQPARRCREVVDLLMAYGAKMGEVYGEADVLGGVAPAFLELLAARKRRAALLGKDKVIQALHFIKACGGELHRVDGVRPEWASSRGGPPLDMPPHLGHETVICALLNDGLLEPMPGNFAELAPRDRSATSYRLTPAADAKFSAAMERAWIAIENARAQAKRGL
ncbi:hypothetical protein [Paraburkholderia youngii]|uniref:hypothetical protein n=1 Tax=Paraburkholderia youngii TaxID=2782701 RepID=UPI003D1A5C43